MQSAREWGVRPVVGLMSLNPVGCHRIIQPATRSLRRPSHARGRTLSDWIDWLWRYLFCSESHAQSGDDGAGAQDVLDECGVAVELHVVVLGQGPGEQAPDIPKRIIRTVSARPESILC